MSEGRLDTVVRAESMARLLVDRVASTPDDEAFRYRDAEAWISLTWREVGERVRALSAALLQAGLRREDTVAIVANTRIEWALADYGIVCAGGATTTVYPSTPAEDVAYIVRDAGCRFAVVEDGVQLAKLLDTDLPALERLIVIDPAPAHDDPRVVSLAAFEQAGRAHLAAQPGVVDEAVAAIDGESLATLIYTSGTTGRPKGVRLSHDCWTYEAAAVEALDLISPADLHFLWLPLSHALGKMWLAVQLQIGYPTAIDGDVTRIVENLGVLHPTFMCAAPRIFEKAYARVVATATADGGAKEKVFRWAQRVGARTVEAQQSGRPLGAWQQAQHRIADTVVFSKVRERFGGRLRFFVSGSAALAPDISAFFLAAGLPILEGYGLTETSAACSVNRPETNRIGTVGSPLPGSEFRIAEDGEVLVRGPGVMRGYHRLPELTTAAFADGGWLRTGDIGELDEAGRLRLTDRKKDLIKTSNGKYVAPQPMETRFKSLCPLVSNIVILGDGRSFVSALLALDPDALEQWAAAAGRSGESFESLASSPEVNAVAAAAVKQLNDGLAHWETVKRFAILPRDLTIDDGELTPSLKVKRRVVAAHFADVVDGIYADASAGV